MLIDAERIEQEIRNVEERQRAGLVSLGFHEPDRLFQENQRAIAALETPMPTLSEEDLIAYALQRQKDVREGVS